MKYRILSRSLEFPLITGCNCSLKPLPHSLPLLLLSACSLVTVRTSDFPSPFGRLFCIMCLQPQPCPLTASINLILGLLRFLFPGNSILSIRLPIYPSSSLRRCPYHLSLASCFLSKPSHLHCPPDVLIPDPVPSLY